MKVKIIPSTKRVFFFSIRHGKTEQTAVARTSFTKTLLTAKTMCLYVETLLLSSIDNTAVFLERGIKQKEPQTVHDREFFKEQRIQSLIQASFVLFGLFCWMLSSCFDGCSAYVSTLYYELILLSSCTAWCNYYNEEQYRTFSNIARNVVTTAGIKAWAQLLVDV